MGNQESLMYKRAVYQDQGKYIVPTKIKAPSETQETEIIKNIFGVQDPTLLTRSYWAKNPNKTNSLQRNLSKSPSKSRKLIDSSVGVSSRHHANDWQRQSGARPERQILGKSIVSNFRQDLKETPARNLSKITSCSIITKLNPFEADLQSTSAIKLNEKPSISNIFSYKNKQNFNHDEQGSPIPSSKRIRKTQGMQNSALQKSRLEQNRESQAKKSNVMSQLSKVFGVTDVSNIEDSRCNQSSKNSIKSRQENTKIFKDPFLCQNARKEIQSNKHTVSVGFNQEICEQTFSKFQENPALICSSNQDKSSQKSKNFDLLSKKTYSKHSEIEKFDGLNEDSKNESLMKVLKKITEISVDNQIPVGKTSHQESSHFVRENASQIFNENAHQHNEVSLKQSQKSKTQKSESTQKYQEPPFEFVLHEINKTSSKKSANDENSVSNKSSSNFSKNQRNPIYSEASKANSKSLSKASIHHLTEAYEKNERFQQNKNQQMFAYLDNEESQQTQQKNQNSNDEFFKCSKMKSPKSITSEQVGLNRQRSCAGRIVETSKAADQKEYSSPFKSKKYDFSKKEFSRQEKQASKYECQNRQISIKRSSPSEIRYSKNYMRSPTQKSPSQRSPSRKSPTQKSSKTLSNQLMLKIETLEGELNTLKLKEELQKFESRRCSPVKQEKFKRKGRINEHSSISSNEQEDPQYCINELSKSKPLKHRAHYFKLKLK